MSMNANPQSVEVVIPVHNEKNALRSSVELLLDYLRVEYPFRFAIVIATNASVDSAGSLSRLVDRSTSI